MLVHLPLGTVIKLYIDYLTFNIILHQVLGRTIRVDHCKDYKPPKEHGDEDDITKDIRMKGVAPQTPPSSPEEEEELLDFSPAKKGRQSGKFLRFSSKEEKNSRQLIRTVK